MGLCLVCSRNREEANVPGAESLCTCVFLLAKFLAEESLGQRNCLDPF